MKLLKTLSSIIYAFLIAFLVLVAVGTALSVVKAPGGVRLFVVLSGSMEPSIKIASVVVVAPQNEYREGEVITFFANPTQTDLKKSGTTVTHRIIKVNDDEGRPTYNTKGDANEDSDREMVAHRSVLGKVLFSIPYLGRVIAFTKTQMGFVALIIIPGTLIVYSELMSIKKEIKKIVDKKKKKVKPEEVKKVKQEKEKIKTPKVKKTGRKFKQKL
jgi:signal peptidase I